MNFGPHPYQELSLSTVGILLGLTLIGSHAFMLAKPSFCQEWLKKLPRHYNAGVYVMGLGMIWFWLLVQPEPKGSFSFLSFIAMDLGEFEVVKRYLLFLVPAAYIGLILYVREFLFVRGLGLVLLMLAAPLLAAAFLKEPSSRILISLYAYLIIVAGLYFVGMPYLFRDFANWASEKTGRWSALCLSGLVYGLAVLICAFAFWRGH